MQHLRVYESPWPKRRVGRPNDGGYVIAELGGYDAVISGGIAGDISFEQALLDMLPSGTPCWAFDGTISALPAVDSRIQFTPRNLGAPPHRTLREELTFPRNAFVKIDIEGHEYALLGTWGAEHFAHIKQLVIEFHTPADIALHPTYYQGLTSIAFWDTVAAIARSHVLIHVHPNNVCGTHMVEGCRVPNVFECTYVRADLFPAPPRPSTEVIPGPLDQPNRAEYAVVMFEGAPWHVEPSPQHAEPSPQHAAEPSPQHAEPSLQHAEPSPQHAEPSPQHAAEPSPQHAAERRGS